jgi:hypothetical protein
MTMADMMERNFGNAPEIVMTISCDFWLTLHETTDVYL